MKAGVEKALAAIRTAFAGKTILVSESPCGGAYVIIEDVPLGLPYEQDTTWIGFFLSSACPDADTYPFYVRSDLKRADGVALKVPLHINHTWPSNVAGMPARSAVMVSRRQNNTACLGRETPVIKLLTVLKWMLEQ